MEHYSSPGGTWTMIPTPNSNPQIQSQSQSQSQSNQDPNLYLQQQQQQFLHQQQQQPFQQSQTMQSQFQQQQLYQQQQQQRILQQQQQQPQPPPQQQQNLHQSLASHFHLLNLVENLAEVVEHGNPDQQSDALKSKHNVYFVHPMASNNNGPVIVVIMGVSGAGKTTIGQRLEKEIKYKYLDADDFHSQSNKVKTRMGIPLTDEDRMPWLESLRDAIKESLINKKGLVLGCSALKKQYREILRSGDPDYKLESYASAVNFILLDAPAEVLIARLNKRAAEGKHYMPASLLQSQLDLLNIDESEGILRVDATLSPESIVNTIKEMHPFQGCFKS